MTTQIVNARIDAQLKKEVDYILSKIGLTSAEAIRLYYTQIKNKKGIPFSLTLNEEPNKDVKEVMKRVDAYIRGEDKNRFQSFSSVQDMMNTILTEADE